VRTSTAGQRRGADTEAAARRLLERAGLQLLAANVHCGGGELDLVMRDGQTVVFVEVRYRRDSRHGGAVGSVDRAKRHRLLQAAQGFLARHPPLANAPCRFDVIAAEGEPVQLQWLRDAFRADDA
jgi:putative endonuclease